MPCVTLSSFFIVLLYSLGSGPVGEGLCVYLQKKHSGCLPASGTNQKEMVVTRESLACTGLAVVRAALETSGKVHVWGSLGTNCTSHLPTCVLKPTLAPHDDKLK